jgi:hypothetical protein
MSSPDPSHLRNAVAVAASSVVAAASAVTRPLDVPAHQRAFVVMTIEARMIQVEAELEALREQRGQMEEDLWFSEVYQQRYQDGLASDADSVLSPSLQDDLTWLNFGHLL